MFIELYGTVGVLCTLPAASLPTLSGFVVFGAHNDSRLIWLGYLETFEEQSGGVSCGISHIQLSIIVATKFVLFPGLASEDMATITKYWDSIYINVHSCYWTNKQWLCFAISTFIKIKQCVTSNSIQLVWQIINKLHKSFGWKVFWVLLLYTCYNQFDTGFVLVFAGNSQLGKHNYWIVPPATFFTRSPMFGLEPVHA